MTKVLESIRARSRAATRPGFWIMPCGRLKKPERSQRKPSPLSGLTLADCRHCNWCMTKQTPDRLCVIQDDASPILEKIRECDVLILASPVYFSRLSGTMACLIDRTRCFTFGKSGHLALKGKVGAALAVGWCRNLGMETTLASIHGAFLVHEMPGLLPRRGGPFTAWVSSRDRGTRHSRTSATSSASRTTGRASTRRAFISVKRSGRQRAV